MLIGFKLETKSDGKCNAYIGFKLESDRKCVQVRSEFLSRQGSPDQLAASDEYPVMAEGCME